MELNAARVFVRDLASAKNFYSAKLGLALKADGTKYGYCVFKTGSTELVVEVVAGLQRDRVDLIPRVSHARHEKSFEDAALADRFQRHAFAGFRKQQAARALAPHESLSHQALRHARYGRRRNIEPVCQRPQRHSPSFVRFQIDFAEKILHRRAARR